MSIHKETIFNLLAHVAKPARYTGGEWNAVVKPNVPVRIGLCFPDLYEVGMSNSGIQILYNAVNTKTQGACERVFAVELDFENILRQTNTPLYTLETYTPLYKLDMVGFNAACELLYTNILQVLDLGKIPLYAKDRGDSYPLIIIGGEAISNPAPLLPFADAFFFGDGEEAIIEIVNVLINAKKDNVPRNEVLKEISKIEGVLCSRDVTMVYDNTKLIEITAPPVVKRTSPHFADFEPTRPVVPSIRSVQDRVSVQLDRGCKNLCKFCHAGYWELPYRKTDVTKASDAIFKTVSATGFSDVSLHSLSVGDYSQIVQLLNVIVPPLIEEGITISLPSLRVDSNSLDIIESISDLKKTSLTFAVESASDALRYRAYKRLAIDEIMSILQELSQRGWQRIKLYFMIGLPGCQDVDEAADIIAFMKQAHAVNKKIQYNVTISPFVPKPHTPFQYEKQYDESYCLDVITRIKRNVPKSVTIKNHDVYATLIEGVFARGDSLLAPALVAAYNNGARLDLWGEHFSFSVWDNALQQTVGNWRRYLEKRNQQDVIPWNVVQTRYNSLIVKKSQSNWDGTTFPPGFTQGVLDKSAFARAAKAFEKKYNVAARLRLQYAKKGRARFIGHIDCMEIVKRALRMAQIPVAYTQGFSKHPRIITSPALPLGYESNCEYVDVELYEYCSDSSLKKLFLVFPEDFTLLNAYHHDSTTMPLQSIAYALYSISFHDSDCCTRFIHNLRSKSNIVKKTKKGLKNLCFDDAIVQFTTTEKTVTMLMSLGEDSIRPDSLIADWCLVDTPLAYATISKDASYYLKGNSITEFV